MACSSDQSSSDVWSHFSKFDNGKPKVICEKSIAYCGGTTEPFVV